MRVQHNGDEDRLRFTIDTMKFELNEVHVDLYRDAQSRFLGSTI